MKLFIASLVATSLVFFSAYPAGAQVQDSDQDNLSDQVEITVYRTHPHKADTDGDGFSDGEEVRLGFSPLEIKKPLRQVDTDKDGAWDDWEIALGTDVTRPDTDGDGFNDGTEILSGHNPLSADDTTVTKRIEVRLKEQKLAYYFGDKKLDEFAISSGLPGTPSPKGNFSVLMKRPVVHYGGGDYNYPNTKWNLMFKRGSWGNYYVHGAYWHNKFGQTRSHGCINVPHKYEYMGRLYDWASVGMPVSVQ